MKGNKAYIKRGRQKTLKLAIRAFLSLALVVSMAPMFAMSAFAEEDIIENDLELIEAENAEDKCTEFEEPTIEDEEGLTTDDEANGEVGVEEADLLERFIGIEETDVPEGFIGIEEIVAEALDTTLETVVAVPLVAAFIPIIPTNGTTPPPLVTGRFTLDPGFTCGPTYSGDFPGTIVIPDMEVYCFGTDPGGTNGHLTCLELGAENWGDTSPTGNNNRFGTVYASWRFNDEAAGLAWYWIDRVDPDKPVAPPGSVYGIQPVGGAWLALRWDFDGIIELYKRSAAPDITDGNNCYSLEGAQYGIYPTSMDAANNTNVIEILTTDVTGYAVSGRLTQKTYWVRELVASPGYYVDNTIYTVVLNSTYYLFEVKEMPADDPLLTIVRKLDTSTGGAWGMDDAIGKSLAGAQFTIRYYNSYYDTVEEAEASGLPTRTWIIETGIGGAAALGNPWLVDGSDALYYDVGGNPTIPLGTVITFESKAPDSYLLPDPIEYNIQQVRFDADLQEVIRLNEIIVPEQPRELELIKVDGRTGEVLPGAVFEIYKESAPGSGIWEFVAEKTTGIGGTFTYSPIAIGSYKLVETMAPAGYLLPAAAGFAETFFTIDGDTETKILTIVNYRIIVDKIDRDTKEPVADTEFTLYRYPAPVVDGLITVDVSQITADDPGWVEIARTTTNSDGKAVFPSLPFGYYMLVESRPNPNYASYKESGGEDRFVVLDKYATGEAQVFEDEVIQISCEVYKKTIALTSSALDGTNEDTQNNVGSEEYLYRFGARSNSNVWVDEFIIVDDLSYVTSLGYRMTTLWTGTAPDGMDFDDKMAILYKTNKTEDDEQPIFSYNPLSANPENPNNPNRNMIYSNTPGWRIWAEELSTTTQIRLDVADLNLAEDEFIIGLKIVYGGVVKDFYTGNGWQTVEELHTMGHTGATNTAATTTTNESIEDWWYAVVATQGLKTSDEMGNETIMKGSVQADIARNNGVLTDNDIDAVETRVIEPFSYPTTSVGFVGIPMSNHYPNPNSKTGVPQTGDQWAMPAAFVGTLVMGIALTVASRQSRRYKQQHEN